jgi:hypothetical protein
MSVWRHLVRELYFLGGAFLEAFAERAPDVV